MTAGQTMKGEETDFVKCQIWKRKYLHSHLVGFLF